jgi:hypothetical protein
MAINRSQFSLIDYVDGNPENAIVLIGTGYDGPSNVPFKIGSDTDATDVLGASPLAKAYNQAYTAGASNIILYRLNGTHGTATLSYRDQNDLLIDVLRFKSVSANDIYNSVTEDGDVNNIKVEINGTALIVTKTDGTKRTYVLSSYMNAELLADALNTDSVYGLIEFETVALIPDFSLSMFTDDTSFTALFSGASTEESLILQRSDNVDITAKIAEMKSRLNVILFGENAEDQLNGEPNTIVGLMDYGGIAVADLYYEDDPDLAIILGKFCQNKSAYSGYGCMAILGTTPLYNPTLDNIEAKATNLNNLSPIIRFRNPGGLDDGTGIEVQGTLNPLNYVQIVTGDTMIVGRMGELPKPFSTAFGYLGTMVAIPYYMNPTNKPISSISNLSYEFSKENIDNLASNGYISIVSSIRKGYVAYLALTCVGQSSKSSFKKPHYIRMSQHISRILNNDLDNLVGSTRERNTKVTIERRINDLMQNLVDSGAIRGYVVVCEFSNYNMVLTVSVSFTPYSDVESITTMTTLPLGQGVT